MSTSGFVEVVVEPVPWRPRRDSKRRSKIVNEHRRRLGDPAVGGSTRQPIMTAYRQQALACAAMLSQGRARPRDLKIAAPDAPKILQGNVYDWFVRVDRGIYDLTETGRAALVRWKAHLPQPVAPPVANTNVVDTSVVDTSTSMPSPKRRAKVAA